MDDKIIISKIYNNTILHINNICFPTDIFIKDRRNNYFYYYKNKKIVAYAVGVKKYNNYYLERSAVLPSHRGHGIQKELILARMNFAKNIRILSYVKKDNVISIHNMKKMNFTIWEKCPKKYRRKDFFLFTYK